MRFRFMWLSTRSGASVMAPAINMHHKIISNNISLSMRVSLLCGKGGRICLLEIVIFPYFGPLGSDERFGKHYSSRVGEHPYTACYPL